MYCCRTSQATFSSATAEDGTVSSCMSPRRTSWCDPTRTPSRKRPREERVAACAKELKICRFHTNFISLSFFAFILIFSIVAYLLFLPVLDLLYPEAHPPAMQRVRHPQHVVQVFVLLRPQQYTADFSFRGQPLGTRRVNVMLFVISDHWLFYHANLSRQRTINGGGGALAAKVQANSRISCSLG